MMRTMGIISRVAWTLAFTLLVSCGTGGGADVGHADGRIDVVNSDVPSVFDVPGDRASMDVLFADASDVSMMPDVFDAGPYPPGPYGNAQGNVLANLSWEGYVNPAGHVVSTTLPYTHTSLQAMRELGRRYALVHVAEFY